jgi:serpin B
MKSVQVELNLPRFTYAATLDFVPILKSMGMVNAFEFDHADFSGITTEEELAITGIVHKAFVAVDEEGTEAAAATGISFGVTSAAPQDHKVMRVDRPFLFAIRDRHTGAILFMGRVMDPS